MSLSQDILENRKKLEKKIASKYDVSALDFAELFQVPLRVIEKETKDISFTGEKPYDLNKHKHALYDMAKKREKDGMGGEEALASIGMWTEPEYFGEKTKKIKGFTEDMSDRINKGIQMGKYGFTDGYITKDLGLTRTEKEFVKNGIGTPNHEFAKGVQRVFAEKRKDAGDNIEDIAAVNGVNKSALGKGFDAYAIYCQRAKSKVEAKAGESKKVPESTKQDVYRRWKSGECTQQELADEFKVTRITIMNWIRTEKVKNIEDLNQNVPTLRQRNSKKEIRERVESRRNEIGNYFKHYYSRSNLPQCEIVNRISAKFGHNSSIVLNDLRSLGLIATKFETERGKESIELSSRFYQDAYKQMNMVHFGYGPNEGKTKSYGLGEYRDSQKQLEYELNNVPKARAHANKHKGNMVKYWADKEKDEIIFGKKDVPEKEAEVEKTDERER